MNIKVESKVFEKRYQNISEVLAGDKPIKGCIYIDFTLPCPFRYAEIDEKTSMGEYVYDIQAEKIVLSPNWEEPKIPI